MRTSMKLSALAAPLVLAVSLGLTPSESVARTITIQVNHEMGSGTPTARALEWFGEQVEQETDGAVRFRYFHSHELGSERETYDMLEAGAIEMGVSGAQIISALAPEYGALLLPYVFTDADHFGRVMDGTVGEELHQAILDNKGIRILGWAHRAPRHITTSGDREIHSPSDLDGIRIRIREIPVQVDAFRALGARPVPMAFGEVYTGLQTGTIHAQENPVSIMLAHNFHEVQDHIILTSHIREAFWWEVSERVWQDLPEEVRQAFLNNIDEAIARANEWEFETDAEYLERFAAEGVNVVELSDEQLAAFAELVEPVAADYASEWKDGVYDEIVRLRDE